MAKKGEFWLTPPELEHLREGRWDPCPYPWDGSDALARPWMKPWFLNPPFHRATAFVRKALEEGGPGIILLPMMSANYLLLERGIQQTPLGRVRWINTETRKQMRSGTLTVMAVIE